jgi:hypothetical protein
VWTLLDDQLQPIPVETGLSNGVETAIVGGRLSENTPIVTGLAVSAAASPAAGASPLVPQRPGGNRQGGGARANQGGAR